MIFQTGNVIYTCRKASGLTQSQLAEKLLVSSAAVSKWESGNSMPDVESLCRIADYFQLSLDTLLSRGESHKILLNDAYDDEGLKLAGYLVKLCTVSRELGLLAMAEMAKTSDCLFLRSIVEIHMDLLMHKTNMALVEVILNQYAETESSKHSWTHMIVSALLMMTSGCGEEELSALLSSHLGINYRKSLKLWVDYSNDIHGTAIKAIREKSLYDPSEDLLQVMKDYDDYRIQVLLRQLNNKDIVTLLIGASEHLVKRLCHNLSEQLLVYLIEDIVNWHGSKTDILNAQNYLLSLVDGYIDTDCTD